MKLPYIIATTVILSVTALLAGSKGKPSKAPKPYSNPRAQIRGTSIYHWFVVKSMVYVPQDDETNATPRQRRAFPVGIVSAHHNQQGHADNQHLVVGLGRLHPNTNYMLLALLGDDTNYTHVADLRSNRRGQASVQYKQIGSSKGHGNGHVKFALPDFLDPIDQIQEMAVANWNTQIVLQADLTLPDKLHYLIKKNLTNDGVEPSALAALDIKANTRRTWFGLHAGGLQTNATYYLALNGEVSQETTTDAYGDLALRTWSVTPDQVLDIDTVAIWNSSSNSVLSTTLGPADSAEGVCRPRHWRGWRGWYRHDDDQDDRD